MSLLDTLRNDGILIAWKKICARGENMFHKVFSTGSYQISTKIPVFAPYSMGGFGTRAGLTILAANQTFPLLMRLISETRQNSVLQVLPVEAVCQNEASRRAASALKVLFDKYGSDKSRGHRYEYLYGAILPDPGSITSILEIGLGTNNIDIVSNMGPAGRPGASLRAFRDYLPKAQIYGADVDRRILFTEDRIRTFFVDQTDLSTFDALGAAVGEGLDLIIDDGLHCPNANIAVLLFALKKLKPRGWFVVEDIPDEALPVWQVVAALMPGGYTCNLVAAGKANMFTAQRLS